MKLPITKTYSIEEDSLLLKSIRATPMYKFDPLLQGLEKDLLENKFLTQEQQVVLKKIKSQYLPKVLLKPKQADFLRKMNKLPANKMTKDEISIIPKMYAKACAGIEWNDEERRQVFNIMKKYNAPNEI